MQWPLPTRKPKLVAPPGACDTHIHFFDAKYPKHPDGPTPAPDATVDDYRKLQGILGTQRVIVVQANAYGDDNRLTMDGVAALGLDKARAVVVVKPGVSDAEMERLTKAGARAVRFMCVPGGHLKWDVMDEVFARVRPFGWHGTVQFDGRDFVQHEAQLKRIQGDYIIDHTGKFLEPVAPDHDAFKVLLQAGGARQLLREAGRSLRDVQDRQAGVHGRGAAGQGTDQGSAGAHDLGQQLAAQLGHSRNPSRRIQHARPAAGLDAGRGHPAQDAGGESGAPVRVLIVIPERAQAQSRDPAADAVSGSRL